MKEKNRKILYLEWLDSVSSDNNWVSEDYGKDWAQEGGSKIRQVGFLVKETKDFLTLVCAVNPQDHSTKVTGLFKIPKAVITKRKELTISFS